MMVDGETEQREPARDLGRNIEATPRSVGFRAASARASLRG